MVLISLQLLAVCPFGIEILNSTNMGALTFENVIKILQDLFIRFPLILIYVGLFHFLLLLFLLPILSYDISFLFF